MGPSPLGEGQDEGSKIRFFPMKHLARALRRHQTDAEKVLWYRLRNHQLEGRKFRRQQVMGKYIADFFCLELKLVIELDGGQHAERAEQDEQRTQYLQSLGYRVLRFCES